MQDFLPQLQQTQIEILDEFKRVCEKNHLKYYLFFGTLLGAVRHNGFIPWDDDVDVAMPREDYDAFVRMAGNELGESFYLESSETISDCSLIFSKIRKKNTLYLINPTSYNKRPEKERPLGIFIDVFPLDKIGGKTLSWANFKLKLCGLLTGHLYHYRLNESESKSTSLQSRFVHRVLKIFTVKQIKRFVRMLMVGKGNRYMVMAGGYSVGHMVYPVEWFEPATELPFGVSTYAVPKEYDRILRVVYGDDYMELPPVEKRVTHAPMKLSFDLEKENENRTK